MLYFYMLQTSQQCRTQTFLRNASWSSRANAEGQGCLIPELDWMDMVQLCFLVWDCCGQAVVGEDLVHPFLFGWGAALSLMLLTLQGQGCPVRRRSQEPRSQKLFVWICWESSSSAHNISVSCQERLSVLSMETWQVVGWQVQGSWPELHCWCSGITKQDFFANQECRKLLSWASHSGLSPQGEGK